jgi:hypothetical protein
MISTTTHRENQPRDIDALGGELLHSGSQPMRRSRSSCGSIKALYHPLRRDAITACGLVVVKHGDVVGVELHILRDLRLRFADEFGVCVGDGDKLRLRICRQIIQQSQTVIVIEADNHNPGFCLLRVQSSSECQKYQAMIYKRAVCFYAQEIGVYFSPPA